jgi:hypothetical protein
MEDAMSSRKPKKDVRGKPGPKQLALNKETLKDLSTTGKGPVGGVRHNTVRVVTETC